MAEITAKDAKVLCLIARLKGMSEGAMAAIKYWDEDTPIDFIKKASTDNKKDVLKIAIILQELLYPDF